MDFKEIGWGHVEWIYLAQDRNQWKVLVDKAVKLRFP
jgi:hypothetical protein